jgi:hypothetical protein
LVLEALEEHGVERDLIVLADGESAIQLSGLWIRSAWNVPTLLSLI